LLGLPALGVVLAPPIFLRSCITVVCLITGLSLPLSLASGPRWAALLGFAMLVVPLVPLIGIRRRMYKAAAQERLSKHLDGVILPADPGQRSPPSKLPGSP